MVKTIQTKQIHYNDLIDNKVIDKRFGQEIRFTFTLTIFDINNIRRFPMEPFLETLWGPLVPISAY